MRREILQEAQLHLAAVHLQGMTCICTVLKVCLCLHVQLLRNACTTLDDNKKQSHTVVFFTTCNEQPEPHHAHALT